MNTGGNMMLGITDEKTRLLKRYRQLRATSRKLNNRLLEQLSKDTLTESGRKLGLLVDNTLVFNTEDESSVLMDYCIYDGWSDGQNAVTRLLAQNAFPDGSDETLLLEAMSNARYSLYKVQSIIGGLGVDLFDLLRGDSFLLTDEGFSRSAVEGVIVAARVIMLPDFAMSTGAALPIDPDASTAVLNALDRTLGRKEPVDCSRQELAEMSAAIISCALSRGASSHIEYQTPGQYTRHRAPRQRPAQFTSPNSPCPCGSGRKLKKCCGRA